jgi:PTH1 family peptidyl-tRNA hydrolase
MHCIVGLGNPGSQYEGTRHNLGFDVADEIANALHLRFKAGKGEYLLATGTVDDRPLILIKPLTYMNESGSAVLDVQEEYKIPIERLLIVCDDFQLPLGQLRLRPRGSDGGHNGLYSIIYHLQSDQFPRLRCGIASASTPKDKSLMATYVLEPFTREELPAVEAMKRRAKEACLTFVQRGLTPAMNLFNSKLG